MKDLVEKYNQGIASEQEVRELERLIASGQLSISELAGESELLEKLAGLQSSEPSPQMDANFYAMLAKEKSRQSAPGLSFDLGKLWQQFPAFKWAYTLIILAVGFGIGLLLRGNDNSDVNELAGEVAEMKEMMMLTLLEKESTSDRLKAVNLTTDMPSVSTTVTSALIKTLNNDENVNVRLATLEALYPYAENPEVRSALISSIRNQESPLVQMAMAEMMVALQEKKSVEELEFLLRKESTPEEVKLKLEESIQILI